MRVILALFSAFALSLNVVASAETIGGHNVFSFVALGDMPYNEAANHTKFDRLIGAINRLKPAFSIHVGDIKGGGSVCTDAAFEKVYRQFQSFEQPLVYTPGDNEWTDCHRSAQKPWDDPRERLSKLRAIFLLIPARAWERRRCRWKAKASRCRNM